MAGEWSPKKEMGDPGRNRPYPDLRRHRAHHFSLRLEREAMRPQASQRPRYGRSGFWLEIW